MRTHHFTLGIAFLLLTGVVSTANAKTLHFTCTWSASITNGVETNIDTNNDGRSASLAQGIDKCSFGRFLIQDETETTPPATTNTTCPPGTQEYTLVQGHSVFTELTSTDQLFFEATSAAFCLDPTSADLSYSFSGQGIFTGGTGKFAGATGTLNFQGTAKYLVFGVKNGAFGGLGQLTDTESGTLTLPHAGNGKDD